MQLMNIYVAKQVAEGRLNSKNKGSDRTNFVKWEMNVAEASTVWGC